MSRPGSRRARVIVAFGSKEQEHDHAGNDT